MNTAAAAAIPADHQAVYVALCDRCGKVGGGYWEPEDAQRTAERHYEVSGHDARVDLVEAAK